MTSRTLHALFVMAAFAAPVGTMAQTAAGRFMELPGRYAVGLKVVDQHDASRSFGKERARELQTLVWYPASPNTSRPMAVGDYVNLTLSEIRSDVAAAGNVRPERYTKWMSRIPSSLAEPLRAARDAPPSRGSFPVVIYAPSDSAVSWENADLCEYLASQGYVVLASPSMGVATRDMTDDIPGIEAQARDISFLISYAKTLPDTDVSRVAVVGFSWGGMSNLFAAAKDNRIDALVSLDGSMRYFPGLVKDAGYVHPNVAERKVLGLLMEAPGTVVPRADMAAALAEDIYDFDPHRLEMMVHRLRSKIADATGEALPLRTVRGTGYVMMT